jgi:methionine sulfoxide reductase heme-binding subunit
VGENFRGTQGSNNNWLRWSVHAAGWLPFSLLIIAYFTNNLGFNPVEGVLRWTGRGAVVFLLLSLAPTPAHKIFVLPKILRLRKPLGLYAALYAGLHFVAFAVWDYGFNISFIWREIQEKPFIIYGLISLLILLLLTVTSFRSVQRLMGKTWRWLHRLVYAAGILAILHYLLAIKGNLFSLQGAYAPALIAAAALSLLLLLRVPAIHKFLRQHITQK